METDPKMREYQAVVWVGSVDQSGERVAFFAIDREDAKRQLRERYGEGVVFSLYNDEDANRKR